MTDEYWDALHAWRKKHLGDMYRATPPGEETPEALEAMAELARMAKEQRR